MISSYIKGSRGLFRVLVLSFTIILLLTKNMWLCSVASDKTYHVEFTWKSSRCWLFFFWR